MLRSLGYFVLHRHGADSLYVYRADLLDVPVLWLGTLDFLSSLLSLELLILTLLPLPFAWHLPIDKRGSILYNSSEEENAPVLTVQVPTWLD